MTTHSLQKTGLLSKRSEFLPTHVSGASALLRDEPFHQESPSFNSTKQIEALRHLRQIHDLERRSFL